MAKDAKNSKSKDIKNKKHFFKDFKAELKKVIWPTPKQVVNNTIVVITIVLITAIIVVVLDIAFDMLNEYGINKLKSIVKEKKVVENVIDNNTTSESEENTETSENNDTIAEQNDTSSENVEE